MLFVIAQTIVMLNILEIIFFSSFKSIQVKITFLRVYSFMMICVWNLCGAVSSGFLLIIYEFLKRPPRNELFDISLHIFMKKFDIKLNPAV